MYAEKHDFQNRYSRWLTGICAALALWQLVSFLGAETGLPWLPFGSTVHCVLLSLALAVLLLLGNTGLSLRISPKGWAIRFSPYQFSYRHISWGAVRNVRLLKPENLPIGWKNGNPDRSFAHAFLISNPRYAVVCIELVSGFQVFVSVQRPTELMEFLHNGLLQADLKKKVIV